MLAVGVQHDHRVGIARQGRADAGGDGGALAVVGAHPHRPHARVTGRPLELRGDGGRRAVVHEDHLIDVRQRRVGHRGDPVGTEHGDHGGQPPDRRVRGDGGRPLTLGAGERREGGERERAHAEQRAVRARGGDQQAGGRQRGGGRDGARGEEGAGIAAGLALGHERGEVREADGADEAGAECGSRERDGALRDARRAHGTEQPGAEQPDTEKQRSAQALGRHPRTDQHADACQETEAGEHGARGGRSQTEHLIRVEHHERRKRRVGPDPQHLRGQDLTGAVAAQDLGQEAQRRAVVAGARRRLDRRRGPVPCQRRQCEERQREGPEREQRGRRAVDQRAAGERAGERAHEHRALLGARRRGSAIGSEALRDQRPVRRAGGVQADVDRGGGECQDRVRAGGPERDGDEAAARHDRAAEDERPAAAAPVAPQAGRERHDEARRRVHEHHGADQAGPVRDPLEQHRDVGGRHRARRAECDRDGREGPQRCGRRASGGWAHRDAHDAHARTSGATSRR